MSLDNTKREYQRLATVEVVGFMELQVHPKVTGREMLQELLKVYPEGIPEQGYHYLLKSDKRLPASCDFSTFFIFSTSFFFFWFF